MQVISCSSLFLDEVTSEPQQQSMLLEKLGREHRDSQNNKSTEYQLVNNFTTACSYWWKFPLVQINQSSVTLSSLQILSYTPRSNVSLQLVQCLMLMLPPLQGKGKIWSVISFALLFKIMVQWVPEESCMISFTAPINRLYVSFFG